MLTGAAFRKSLEAVLVAQITGMWTAFEALAGDLWEAALNAHPRGLAELKGKRPKSAKEQEQDSARPPDVEEPDETSNERYLLVKHLIEYKFDLSRHMGNALRSRFNFTRLEGIREAYWSAFHKDRDDVITAIMDNSLDDLSFVRNVIVHRAGIVDREFLRKRPKRPPFSSLRAGDRIIVDGEVVHSLAEPVVQASIRLIESVDHWILKRRAEAKDKAGKRNSVDQSPG